MPAASKHRRWRAYSARPRVSGIQRSAARLLYRACGQLRLREVGHTHAAATLAGIDSLHAINSALSVDLLGQVNGEFLSGRQMSDVGGLPDFIAGARQSAAGRGIIALLASPRGDNAASCRCCPLDRHALPAWVPTASLPSMAWLTCVIWMYTNVLPP